MSNELVKIDFHGDEIIAFKNEKTEKVYVNIRRICESLEIGMQSQLNKLRENPVFVEGLACNDIITSYGEKQSWFLDAELLQGWLCTIQPKRIKQEFRDKLIRYQRECFKALHDHFTKGFSLNETALERFPDEVLDRLSQRISERLNIVPAAPLRLERRLEMFNKVFQVLGKPHEKVLAVLRDQVIAEVMAQDPAPTLKESDFWYVADYWDEKKKDGWKNTWYKDDKSFVQVLGRLTASIARRRNFRVVQQNQTLLTGRIVEVNLHCRECLDTAFEKMAKEGKVVRQLALTGV